MFNYIVQPITRKTKQDGRETLTRGEIQMRENKFPVVTGSQV